MGIRPFLCKPVEMSNEMQKTGVFRASCIAGIGNLFLK